jgi:aspartate carbamoyltransferase regulatory subunit
VSAYQQEIPYQARKVFLDDTRASIYEDFGALDVHTVAAGATNDHIDAAYQPMDENADDFEFQVIECVQKIGSLLDINEEDATPLFKRNRISNQKEQVDMVSTEAQWLDHETILKKLPNITVDEIPTIIENTAKEAMDRFAESTIPNEGDMNDGRN